MIHVYILDDHKTFREGLKLMLGEIPGIRVTGICGSSVELAGWVMQGKPDVILMDLHLQQNDIFHLTSAFSHIDPPPAIILLSMSDERKYREDALKAGARAVVLKQKAGEEIIPILMKLFPGEIGTSQLQETDVSGKNT